MHHLSIRRYGCLVALAAVTGCGSAQTTPSASQPVLAAPGLPQSARALSIEPPAGTRAASWMRPNVGGRALLYVTNFGNGTVSVFAYDAGQNPELVGTLSGFGAPVAACSDPQGNVFVGDFKAATISEFAHGATSPTRVLQDAQAEPEGCAIDPTTGNLAAINWSCTCGTGNVAIYDGATGAPTIYTNPEQTSPESGAFDPRGNLFVDGVDSNGRSNVFEMRKGSKKFQQLTVKGGTLSFPGQVLWGGDSLLIGDQQYRGKNASAVYETALHGTSLVIRRTIVLTGTVDVAGFAKRGTGDSATLAAPDAATSAGFVFSFPSGRQLSSFSNLDLPIGAAISQAGS